MDLLQKLRTQAEQVEVVELLNEATTVNFEANHLKGSKVEETKGTAVRVVRNGQLGFAASTLSGAEDKLIQNALESAAYGDRLDIQFPAAHPAKAVRTYDEKIACMPVSRLVEMGKEVLAIILDVAPEAKVNVSLERAIQRASIRNQAGAEVNFERSPLSGFIEVMEVKGDDVLILYEVPGFTVWEDEFRLAAERLAEKLKMAQKVTGMPSGRMPVVFTPAGALVLAIPLAEGLNGKNVFMGTSPIGSKLGEQLFDRKFSLVDDGTLDGKFGSAAYDDEGIPHQRLPMIEAGVLQSFYYDLKTAFQAGTVSTGNGSRSLFNPPAPALTNGVILAGDQSYPEIIAGIKDGILVDTVLGLGQGNILSGAFSNPLSLAFKIENGEITGRVKGASIAGNIYEVLKSVAAISREQEWVYQSFCAPYLLIEEMNVVAG